MSEPTNAIRSNWAQLALTAFNDKVRSDAPDVLADLLADLMHWADSAGYDFDQELSRARSNYVSEK